MSEWGERRLFRDLATGKTGHKELIDGEIQDVYDVVQIDKAEPGKDINVIAIYDNIEKKFRMELV